jgi:hypothetical protein
LIGGAVACSIPCFNRPRPAVAVPANRHPRLISPALSAGDARTEAGVSAAEAVGMALHRNTRRGQEIASHYAFTSLIEVEAGKATHAQIIAALAAVVSTGNAGTIEG